ncbi:MAG: N-acetyltransferase [Verrucomicrobiota bacterium]|jgi:ribosomal protein S18 acetylase RimI-like enzyme|nr:GNAT family N-acetyltransferase [Verrucomicrobiales bacterium]MEE2943061.1 N-acetyltransferase [Verrucomicrobiota bacterium]|tara:strand:+ start:587 stop:1036 length:450 start_codon:yes stop_codon:yes gene_type:complete
MNVTICRATADDVGAISKLFNAYRVFFGQDSDLSLSEEFLRSRLNNSESVVFCAYNLEKNCVGFAQLYQSFSSVSAKHIWILNDLFVLESLRGMGIGKKLLCEIEKFCKETQSGGVLVETTISNTGAQKLYEFSGYQKMKERVFYEWKN